MPRRAATIESLPTAFEVVKAMRADGLDWARVSSAWPASPGRDQRDGDGGIAATAITGGG